MLSPANLIPSFKEWGEAGEDRREIPVHVFHSVIQIMFIEESEEQILIITYN